MFFSIKWFPIGHVAESMGEREGRASQCPSKAARSAGLDRTPLVMPDWLQEAGWLDLEALRRLDPSGTTMIEHPCAIGWSSKLELVGFTILKTCRDVDDWIHFHCQVPTHLGMGFCFVYPTVPCCSYKVAFYNPKTISLVSYFSGAYVDVSSAMHNSLHNIKKIM